MYCLSPEIRTYQWLAAAVVSQLYLTEVAFELFVHRSTSRLEATLDTAWVSAGWHHLVSFRLHHPGTSDW